MTLLRSPWLPRLLVAILSITALAWFAPEARGFPLDDAWIHQVVARTLARSGTLGYAPGQHGAAATSALWALVLAANAKWLHVDAPRFAFVVNGALAVVSAELLYDLLSGARPAGVRVGAWQAASLGATALACASGNFLWFAWSGMEASAIVALSLATAWAATRDDARRRGTYALLAGVAAGLAALARPECLPLGALLFVFPIGRRRTSRERAAIVAPWLVLAGAYATLNLVHTGHLAPPTLAGRRWLWLDPIPAQSGAARVVELAEAWATRIHAYVLAGGIALTWIALGLAAYGAVRLLREKRAGLRLLFAWTACHAALYAVLLPVPGHGGRYQPLVPLLFVASAAMGAVFVAWDLTRPFALVARTDVVAAALLVWVPSLRAGALAMRRANELAVLHVDATELATGAFVRTLPEDAVVASFDIGGIGWAADRPLVDLGGLSDAATAPLHEDGRMWELLAARHVRYVVLPEEYTPVLPAPNDYPSRLVLRDNPALALEPVFRAASPPATWGPAFVATFNAAPAQAVYSVSYTGAPGPRRVASPLPDARRPLRDDAPRMSGADRAAAEHALAVLDAWGVAVDVRVERGPPQPSPSAPSSDAPCTIALGAWGVDASQCHRLGDPRIVEAALFEMLGRYLDVGDLGGAARAVAHAVARVERRGDPTFCPKLPPLAVPRPLGGATAAAMTAGWGVPLAAGVFAVAIALSFVRLARIRLIRARRDAARGASR
jgi:hypothetical protein